MKKENYNVLSYYGKGLKEMTWHELQQEHAVIYWWTAFVRKELYRIEQITTNYAKQVERENSAKYADAKERYDNGEISQYSMYLIRGQIANKERKLSNRIARMNYMKMVYYEGLAYKALIKERWALKPKPKKRAKPRQGIYKNNHFKPRKATVNKGRPAHYAYINFQRWTNEQERKGLGELWNKEVFDQICANKGYTSDIMIHHMIATELGSNMVQAKYMYENGCFTWLQIMLIGAALQLTPTEFAECFMSGYFKEIGNGLYQATYDKIPKEAVISVPIFESADEESEDS